MVGAHTLSGSRTTLDDLRADDLGTLQLDLRTGRVPYVELDASMFHVPEGLVAEQLYPPRIELRWDDVITRVIPVQVSRTGELATISRLIADAEANVVRVDHTRVGPEFSMGGVHITIDMETRGHEHSEHVLAALREAGYAPEQLY